MWSVPWKVSSYAERMTRSLGSTNHCYSKPSKPFLSSITMELKPYQQKAIDDLRSYLELLVSTNNFSRAYEEHLKKRYSYETGVLQHQAPPYKNLVPQCPHVCLKVPTAGGKTFIACNALKPIFDVFPLGKSRVVVWLVPSLTILDQTVKSLQNPDHPYRQRINTHFNGRVEVYEKDELLQGASFNATAVQEQLSIFVLSFDSLRSNKKEGRKFYQENSNLENFVPEYGQKDKLLKEVDETALIQVINQLNPVCIVDESHNAETDLSIEMLQNLNPSFILDLTATPRNNSNIISFTDAYELKRENMVKLPVIVYNHQNREAVISDALQLRDSLERKAVEEEQQTGRYIRPIILFQAEPQNSEDTVTFARVKERLIEVGIPAEQIAIKTANINEIKNVDLFNRDCPIRYIITVNALKEGWDCSFAYVLASLANKTSAVDVEQILGRILRQPYAMKHNDLLLNLSYVFTASVKFQETLDNIILGLNKAGFSKNDYRVIADEAGEARTEQEIAQAELGFASASHAEENEEMIFDPRGVSLPGQGAAAVVTLAEEQAIQESREFEQRMQEMEQSGTAGVPIEILSKVGSNGIKEAFKAEAEAMCLPQFHLRAAGGQFFEENDKVLLDKQNLMQGFDLSQCDTSINFEQIDADIYRVDLEDKAQSPTFARTTLQTQNYLLQFISSLPEEKQKEQLAGLLLKTMGNIPEVKDSAIQRYIERVISGMNAARLTELKDDPSRFARIIKKKVQELLEQYAERNFYQWIDADRLLLSDSYQFPKQIIPTDRVALIKSLYEEEGDINSFERRVIDAVAHLDNVLFWHRNLERKGFYINGAINHYPDFIIRTHSGKTVIMETKGDDRDNSDSKAKLKLGQRWASMAGNGYKYFMVFDTNAFEGAHNFGEFLEVLRSL